MYRPARERIITLEVIKLERRQALERERRARVERPQPACAPRAPRPRPGRLRR